MGKFAGSTGVAYLWEKIKALVSGKADRIPEVTHGTSDTTFTLTPNVMHIWGYVTSLTLSLPTDSDSYLDEYLITFTAGANFQMYLPNTVKWVQELETEENKVYQVSIQYNLAGWLTNDMPTGSSGGGGAGDVNIIESISVNGTPQTVTNKNVDIDVPTDLADLSDDATHRLVTDTEKSAWNAKGTYSKPSGGIPATDLASEVQTSLGKADTALQSYTETDPTVPSWAKQSTKPTYTASEVGALPNDTPIPDSLSDLSEDSTHRTVTDTEKSTWNSKGTYSKPSGGIPKTDLDSSVQNSLGLADTALQSFTESDPTVPSWAKQATKPSYTASEVGAVPTTRTVNGKALSADISLTASDVGAVDASDVVTIYSGSSTPSGSLGSNGDIYIQTS